MGSVIVDRIGHFTVVPNAFIDQASFSHEATRLFLVLRRMSNGQDDVPFAFPSYDTIKAKTGIRGYATIAKALRELEEAGWITRQKRFGKSTVYTLCVPSRREGLDSPSSLEGLQQVKGSPSRGEVSVLHQVKPNKTKRYQDSSTKSESAPARRTIEAPAALKNQPAPGARRPGWLGPITDDPRVTTYIALTGYTPNKLQADEILAKVTDLAKWEQTIRQRSAFGCSVVNVAGERGAIEDYLAGGPKAFAKPAPANGQAAGKSNGRTHRLPQKTYTDTERAQKEHAAAARDKDEVPLDEMIARVRAQIEKQPSQYLNDYLASLLARQAQSEVAHG